MKKFITCLFMTSVILTTVFCGSVPSFAAEGYDQVAGSGEMTTVEEVGIEGMKPISAKDVKDGEYDVTVESSSSMFHVEKASLTVKDGKMQAVMTMSGTGYLKVFMGTAKEAAAAELSEYISFEEDQDGKHTFTIPVEALDQAISCAAFSKNKEKWYDRSLLFEAESLPEGAVLVELPDYEALEKAERDKRIAAMKGEENTDAEDGAVSVQLEDGEYTVEADLEGGTGRASITSPAILIVKNGKAYARIEWSSPNYDYMLLDGEKYLPLGIAGNSTFEIPITAFDKEIPVTADTTAMSVPHEIEYTLLFHSDSLPSAGNHTVVIIVIVIAVLILAAALVILFKRKKSAK
ncbi:LPXTG cell wall anchor domain-containing protein [bacterium 210820-DFI.6.37]|nr:LPXTG cell wall anchor domain-containing protein [bacterium 210820-DFI.6.37]